MEAVPTAMEEDRNDRIHRNREHLRSLLSSSSAPGPSASKRSKTGAHAAGDGNEDSLGEEEASSESSESSSSGESSSSEEEVVD